MVVAAVICLQRFVVERRDRERVAPGVEPVRGAGKQDATQCPLELVLGLAHQALHFAQHHAAAHRPLLPASVARDLDAASFLIEVEPVEARKERRVHVDGKQVLVVDEVARGEVVGGAVLGGGGVHGRAQRAAQHREERAPAWKALAPAHHQVLQDVREAARIGGRGEEGHPEGAVLERRREMEVPRAARYVDGARELSIDRSNARAMPALETGPYQRSGGGHGGIASGCVNLTRELRILGTPAQPAPANLLEQTIFLEE